MSFVGDFGVSEVRIVFQYINLSIPAIMLQDKKI